MNTVLEIMGSAPHHEVTQVKKDEATGKKITTKSKGLNPTGMAVLVKAMSGVNYFFGLTTTISPAQRQLDSVSSVGQGEARGRPVCVKR